MSLSPSEGIQGAANLNASWSDFLTIPIGAAHDLIGANSEASTQFFFQGIDNETSSSSTYENESILQELELPLQFDKGEEKGKDKKIEVLPIRGIPNLGNTCWLATLLQLLCTTEWFESIYTGNLHDFNSEEERQRLIVLQAALREAVTALKNPSLAVERKNYIEPLLQALAVCGMIEPGEVVVRQKKVKRAEPGSDLKPIDDLKEALKIKEQETKTVYAQYDATEILITILNRMGKAPDFTFDKVITYSDASTEIRKGVEHSSHLTLQIGSEKKSVTQLLQARFGKEEGLTGKFEVRDEQGALIKTYDTSIGRCGSAPQVFLRIGKKAASEQIKMEQIAYIKTELSADLKACDVKCVDEKDGKVRFDVCKENQVVATFDGNTGLSGNAPVFVKIGRKAKDDEILREQVVYLEELHSAIKGVKATYIKVEHTQLKVAKLPHMIELHVNELQEEEQRDANSGHCLEVDQEINLSSFVLPDIDSSLTTYELEACICRIGAQINNEGGHFWYYKKEGSSWTCFNDSSVEIPSLDAQITDFSKHGYAFFYRRKRCDVHAFTEGESFLDPQEAMEIRESHGV